MRYGYVGADQVTKVWSQVAPMLAKAYARGHGRFSLEQTLQDIRDGKVSLWVAFEGRIRGAAVVEINTYAGGRKAALIFAVAGTGMSDWVEGLLGLIVTHAKANGCTALEAGGRMGWIRHAPKHGFKPVSMFFEKEI